MSVTLTRSLPPLLGAGIAFCVVAGGFGVGLGVILRHDPAPAEGLAPQPPDPAPRMTIYLPFGEPLALPLADGSTALLELSFALSGPPEALLALQAADPGRQARMRALLLAEAQDAAQDVGDAATLRAALPARLRAAINGSLGSAELPEPVTEVLITSFLHR